jgi:hypothetical protein
MIFEGGNAGCKQYDYVSVSCFYYRYPPHSFRGTCYCIFSDSSYLDVVLLRFDSDG